MKLAFIEAEQPREFTLPATTFIIGRQKQCGLSIRDLSISKQHCECTLAGNQLRIRDIGSRNGTWVNGERIGDQFVDVSTSDDLIIGKVPMQFLEDGAASSPQPPPPADAADMGVAAEAPVAAAAAPPEPIQSQDDEGEGTMFDPDFGSSAAWGQRTASGGGPGPDTQKWDQSMEVAQAVSGDQSMLRGEIFEPGLPGTQMALSQGAHFIGTDETSAVRLSSAGVSGSHARLTFDQGKWWIEDLGSKNGTYVNKQQTSGRAPVAPGDTIFVGPVKIELARSAAPAPQAAAVADGGAVAPGGPGKKGLKPLHIGAILFGVLIIGVIVAAQVMKGKGGETPKNGGKTSKDAKREKFVNAVRAGVSAMEKDNFEDAKTHLGDARTLEPKVKVVMTLIEINTILSEEPTAKISELIEKARTVAEKKNKIWETTKAKSFCSQLVDKWEIEKSNAKHASIGEEHFKKEEWKKALDAFRRIKKDSEFYDAKKIRLDNCRRSYANKLAAEGDLAFKNGDADTAIASYNKALEEALPTQYNGILKKKERARNNKKHGTNLRKAREAKNLKNYKGALVYLDKIPPNTAFSTEAAKLRTEIDEILVEQRAKELYAEGRGPDAAGKLDGQVSAKLIGLRETILRVHRHYTQAKQFVAAKKYKEANSHWKLIISIVPDRGNKYRVWAEAGIKVDPKQEAARLADEAKEDYDNADWYPASKKARQALRHDKTNKAALDLMKLLFSKVRMAYNLLYQDWVDKKKDNAAFVKEATPLYKTVRQVKPNDRFFKKIHADILKAGGKIPPKEKEKKPDED